MQKVTTQLLLPFIAYLHKIKTKPSHIFTKASLLVLISSLMLPMFYNSMLCIHDLSYTVCYADTLVYWEPEQRITYDSIPQLHSQVWAQDSFVHILVNYDFPAMYLRSSNYGETWSDTIRLNVESSTGFQSLVQQDSVVYFTWSENRDGPPFSEIQVDTKYVFFRESNNSGATLDSAIFLGKGAPVSIDASRESVFVDPIVGHPPPVRGAYLISSFDGGSGWSEYLPVIDSTDEPNIAYRNSVLHFAGSRDYKVLYTRSTDFGNSWSTPTIITEPNTVLPKRPRLALGFNQHVYLAWTDNKYSPYMQYDDILFRKSTDDGLTWGSEERLTWDSHCDVGSIDMVARDSMIFIVWNYNGLGNPTPCSLFFLASTDCGGTWRQRETIKEGLSIATLDANVAVAEHYVYVTWRDNQYGSTDEVSIRRGSFAPQTIEEQVYQYNSRLYIYPNPFTELININFGKGCGAKDMELKIFDVCGKEVIGKRVIEPGRIGETVHIDTRYLPSGVYFIVVEVEDVTIVNKVIKMK